MDFRTICQVPPPPFPSWEVAPHVYTIGSCFAQQVAQRMQMGGLPVVQSLFGTVFSPVAAMQQLCWSAGELVADVVETAQGWRSYHLHSTIVAPSQETLKDQVAELVASRDQALAQAEYMVLTMGTAWYWELKASGKTVANCQKQPGHWFDKRLATVDQVVAAIQQILAKLPHLKLILTVSPVRHTRETLPGNAVSKSVLRLACHQLQELYPEQVWYFPAYELIVDDLRDYRFYEADMIHPTAVAIDYVWQAFQQACMTPALQQSMEANMKTWRQSQHRPLLT